MLTFAILIDNTKYLFKFIFKLFTLVIMIDNIMKVTLKIILKSPTFAIDKKLSKSIKHKSRKICYYKKLSIKIDPYMLYCKLKDI